jgi:hypothetical protein
MTPEKLAFARELMTPEEREADWLAFYDTWQGVKRTSAEWYAEFRQRKREEAERIDPRTAIVTFVYGYPGNPFFIEPDDGNPEKWTQRIYMVANPGSTNLVEFNRLPDKTRNALWGKRDAADAEGWRRIQEMANRKPLEGEHR